MKAFLFCLAMVPAMIVVMVYDVIFCHSHEWLGCPTQRFGAWMLSKIGPKYLGPTEASYKPRPAPWFIPEAAE
jgi:hypothetical protein